VQYARVRGARGARRRLGARARGRKRLIDDGGGCSGALVFALRRARLCATPHSDSDAPSG
jgi:hypothetical protein